MPILETTITVTTWVCDLCGQGTGQHTSGTGAPIAAQHFIDVLGFRKVGGLVVCSLCRVLPDVANLELARSKAGTL